MFIGCACFRAGFPTVPREELGVSFVLTIVAGFLYVFATVALIVDGCIEE